MKRLLLLPLLILAACDKKPKTAANSAAHAASGTPAPAAAPAFKPGPPPKRSKDGQHFRIDEAMTIADVDFMLRTSTTEAEILEEIAERGFTAQITPAQANALAANGGSPRLIALVQDRQYVLTPAELTEYGSRQQWRAQGGRPIASGDVKQRQKDFELRQQKLHAGEAAASATPKPAGNSFASQATQYLSRPQMVKQELDRANAIRNSP